MHPYSKMIVPALAALTLCACGEALPPAATDELAQAKIVARTEAVEGAQQSPGKTSVPVSIDYRFLGQPTVGEPLQIRLSVGAAQAMQGLTVNMTTGGPLSMSKNSPATRPLKLDSAASGLATGQVDAVVIPGSEGRGYVSVQITGTFEGQPFTKAVAIPVQVGTGAPTLERNGEIIDTGVEVLSSMPASQSVDPVASDQK